MRFVAFLADDFGAWLVAVLSDTGRKKLAHLITGTDEQGRALRSVAGVAIKATASELSPEDPARADFLASVIDELFKAPTGEEPGDAAATATEALKAAVGAQLVVVLEDASRTGVGRSAAEELGVSSAELTEKLYTNLVRQISHTGSRGGPLEPLSNALGHETIHAAIRQLSVAVEDGFARQRTRREQIRPGAAARIGAVYVEDLLAGLQLGQHEAAERRMHRLLLPLDRADQRVILEALLREAGKIEDLADNELRILACSLVEATDRLDPTLLAIEEVEELATSPDFTLRSSAAVLLLQWAKNHPGRVPVPLLSRLSLPSQEDWYVHAAARAGAKTLLLHRISARVVFDRMAASRDHDDRHYAVADLLEVAKVEPRAVPLDLALALAGDPDKAVAARGAQLRDAFADLEEGAWNRHHYPFGM
jgi:hypothetical protein